MKIILHAYDGHDGDLSEVRFALVTLNNARLAQLQSAVVAWEGLRSSPPFGNMHLAEFWTPPGELALYTELSFHPDAMSEAVEDFINTGDEHAFLADDERLTEAAQVSPINECRLRMTYCNLEPNVGFHLEYVAKDVSDIAEGVEITTAWFRAAELFAPRT